MQYKLKFPIENGSKTIDEVTIREKYNAGDFIEIQNVEGGKGDQACRQIALATNLPDPLVKTLSIEDYLEILKISNRFFMVPTPKAKGNT